MVMPRPHFESQLAGGIKGFNFVTTGRVKFDIDWNKQSEVKGVELKRIEIGANRVHPTTIPFTLDRLGAHTQALKFYERAIEHLETARQRRASGHGGNSRHGLPTA